MDYSILRLINNFAGQKIWLDILGIIFSDFLIFAIPLIIILVYFFSKKRRKLFFISLKIIFALVLVCLINYSLKKIIARPRPFVDHNDIYQLAKLFADLKDFSFPSNHAAIAFVMAISVLIDWKKFGLILLGLAVIVGLGRIFVGVHYPTDVLGGIITALVAVFLIKFLGRRSG